MPPLTLLVSLHDVTPYHFDRLVRAEALFAELRVPAVTYLLVPRYHDGWAVDGDRNFSTWCRAERPFAVRWCLHGYRHIETARSDRFTFANWCKRRFLTAGEAEFFGLTAAEISERLDAGRAAFCACIGRPPDGFVAPAWLFADALMPALRGQRFAWTEDRRWIYDVKHGTRIGAPVITWSSRTSLRQRVSTALAPVLLRSWRTRPVVRIALHPFDFDHAHVVDGIRRTLAQALCHRVPTDYETLLKEVTS